MKLNHRHISSSISEWYSSKNWNDVLATLAVAWLFAIPGGALAEYTQVAHLIRYGEVTTSYGPATAAFAGVLGATVGIPFLFAARWLVRRYVRRPFFGLSATLVLTAGSGLATVLHARDVTTDFHFATDIATFAQQELLVGIAWWGPVFLTASVGLWLRDNRPRLRTGATPIAAIALVLLVIASGTAVGIAAPSDDEVGDVGTEGVHGNPQNASLYVDGETGPHVPYTMSENRTEPVPLTDSAFACDQSLTVTNHSIGPASRMVPVESQQRVTDRVSIQRIRFDDGGVVPNRLWLSVDVPEETTHVRSVYISGDDWGEVERDNYPMIGDHEQYIKTEWGEPGVYVLVFATEDGSLHRYWTPICASDPVE